MSHRLPAWSPRCLVQLERLWAPPWLPGLGWRAMRAGRGGGRSQREQLDPPNPWVCQRERGRAGAVVAIDLGQLLNPARPPFPHL